eukprot:Gregarina_sp_Poly_1__10334@NODE_733_length_6558_cov_196_911416_g76_i2_p1_GENE_NODE_733_length_6558_cov_196_911416_g76_i2NODE_733_length_6558_cov_196_911416_g76_i2_p1_ORF_typecomplete_len1202_score178_52AKAP7_NLS/PF10469_9/1_8e132_5_RNA_ligase2/PF13563_6/0_0039XRCC4/PF06632_12/2e02XRCC4/PF06632_12/1_7_NODE_733_length_6558_cov_196_911416_g76_i211874792
MIPKMESEDEQALAPAGAHGSNNDAPLDPPVVDRASRASCSGADSALSSPRSSETATKRSSSERSGSGPAMKPVPGQPETCDGEPSSGLASRSQRPVFNLALNKLQSAGAGVGTLDTPKSTRRQLSSKLSKFVNFFEKSAFVRAKSIDEADLISDAAGEVSRVTTVQTARAAVGRGPTSAVVLAAPMSSRQTPVTSSPPVSEVTPRTTIKMAPERMGSVRDIIKRFDPDGGTGENSARSLKRDPSISSEIGNVTTVVAPPIKRAATLQAGVGSGTSSAVKWQQVEKKIDGKVVGKVWKRFESTSCTVSSHGSEKAAKPFPLLRKSSTGIDGPPSKTLPESSLGGSRQSEIDAVVSTTGENEVGDENTELTNNGIGPSPWTVSQSPESLLIFDPIGEGDEDNLSEGSSSYSSEDESSSGRKGRSPTATPITREGTTSSGDRRERKKKRSTGEATSEDANKTKRASHFVAIRIDDSDVVESVSKFQGELLHSAPFLDHCKSNVNKLHLTLLVLSLTPTDIPRAKQAMRLGVQRFMKAKASILEAHRAAGLRDELQGFECPGRPYNLQGSGRLLLDHPDTSASFHESSPNRPSNPETRSKEDNDDSAFKLDFRTIGAFGTRVLFLSPPLRQRLLLQQFHVELARAFGEHGISIVGAGSGWNSAMEIQKQVLARSEERASPQPTEAALHRKSIDSTTASSASNAASKLLAGAAIIGTDAKRSPSSSFDHNALPPGTAVLSSQPLTVATKIVVPQGLPQQRVYPESATPLDKMLLRQYDLSSARTALYIPQITLFKISKAAKRNKSKSTPSSDPNMPKLKLFPRLYHNLVQRVLQSGLPPPRSTPPVRDQLVLSVNREVYGEQNQEPPVLTSSQWPSTGVVDTHTASPPAQTASRGDTRFNQRQPSLATGAYPATQYLAFTSSPPTGSYNSTPQYLPAAAVASGFQRSPYNTQSGASATPHAFPPTASHTVSPSTIVASSSPNSRQFPYFAAQAPFYNPYYSTSQPNQDQQVMMLAAAAHQVVALQQQNQNLQEAYRRFQDTNDRLYWQQMCIPNAFPSQNVASMSTPPQSNDYNQTTSPMYKSSSSNPTLQASRRSTSNERRTSLTNSARRLRLEKVVTTSWAPNPPFGCQPCSFVELLEMSQMDPDGYYKRICRTMLTPNAEVIDNLIFQPNESDNIESINEPPLKSSTPIAEPPIIESSLSTT